MFSVTDQVFFQHDPKVTGMTARGFQRFRATHQHVHHGNAFAVEQFEREAQALGGIRGAFKSIGHIA